jgi:hypothetical protein
VTSFLVDLVILTPLLEIFGTTREYNMCITCAPYYSKRGCSSIRVRASIRTNNFGNDYIGSILFYYPYYKHCITVKYL